MEFLFILHYLSFLSVSVKRCEKITKGVDRVIAHSTYYVRKQPLAPHDIISNTPAWPVLYYIIDFSTCLYITGVVKTRTGPDRTGLELILRAHYNRLV